MKKNIAVVAGGFSHEAQISMLSAKTVLDSLDASVYNCTQVNILPKGWHAIVDGVEYKIDLNDFSFTTAAGKTTFSCAFIAIHGTPGEDGKLQSYFELIGMPFTTSDSLSSAMSFSKWTTNHILRNSKVPCAQSVLLRDSEAIIVDEILEVTGLPCFVKANNGGSSFGMSKVKKREELEDAIDLARQHDPETLIEAFMDGREVTCGIMKIGDKTHVLPITEIISKNEFFDFEAKYKGSSTEITPADIPEDQAAEVRRLTERVYQTLNLSGIARVDFIIIGEQPHVIEANTVPGLSSASLIPQQLAAYGMPMREAFGALIEDAIG
jgi:D-alanine-D-alanine ligase